MRRARLLINRQGLPQIRILWPVEAKIVENPRYSVSDLLNDINVVFPLDNFNQGLEDYAVEFNGSQLVHFMPIGELICDGDEITIRPLTLTETREFLVGGRTQISTKGRKLLDGIPFGRTPIVPTSDRPPIDIEEPPAKRLRLSGEHTDATTTEAVVVSPAVSNSGKPKSVRFTDKKGAVADNSSALVLAELDDEDEDDEEDGDFNPDDSDAEESEDSDSSESESDDEPTNTIVKPVKLHPRKTHVQTKVQQDSDTSESSDSSGSDSDDSSSSSDDDSDTEAVDNSSGSDSSASSSDSNDSDSDSDSDSSSDSSDDSESLPEEVSSKASKKPVAAPTPKPTQTPKNLPFQGTSSTKNRNQRRKEAKALARLIRMQILPTNATKEDLRKYKEQQNNGGTKAPDVSQAEREISFKTPSQGPDSVSDQQSSGLLADSQSPSYTPMEPLEVAVEQVEVKLGPESQPESTSQLLQAQETSSSPVASRRSRPVASDAAKRLIFGGLGLRKPRNQAEDEKLRSDFKKANAKFVGNKGKGYLDSMVGKEGTHARFDENGDVSAQVDEKATTTNDPDAWKQQIRISAVECDEDYYDENGDDKLPAPSFPFNHNQLRNHQSKGTNSSKKSRQKKNKRKRDEEFLYEEDNWDASYYDESSMNVETSRNLEADEQQCQEDDDMPPVPSNLLDYPKLEKPVLVESIIVFKRLGMDRNYNPTYTQITAQVLSVEGDCVKVQLAKRDCPEVEYDEETGERVYGNFHMPGTEDDDAANGIEEIGFDEMLEGRVIKNGVPSVTGGYDESERVPETVHDGDVLHKDNTNIDSPQTKPQDEVEDFPMIEDENEVDEPAPGFSTETDLSRLSGVVAQSSSFVEPHFQTNGSCGYGHSDTSNASDDEMEYTKEGGVNLEGERTYDSIPSHQPDRSKYSTSAANTTQEQQAESSAEAHRFDDLISQEPVSSSTPKKVQPERSSSQPFNTAPENYSTPRNRESSVQVPGTPEAEDQGSPTRESSVADHWDLSLDISGFGPAEAEKIKKMVKIKDECPEDTELLREALRPYHHPSDVGAEELNISIDISPPASPEIKRERFSTQEALESPPPEALQDITDRSTNGNGIEPILEDYDDEEEGNNNNNTTGSGSGLPGKDQPPSTAVNKDLEFVESTQDTKRSDDPFQARRKTSASFHRRSSNEFEHRSRKMQQDDDDYHHNSAVDDYDDFDIPSTMPVRSLTSGRTAFSGRNDAMARVSTTKNKSELITIDSDSDEEFSPPPPRASLEIVGGVNATTKPGAPRLKKQLIKRKIIPKRGESVGPEGSQGQWRPSSSQH